jgi:K+-transporting ATPase ATPase C chain
MWKYISKSLWLLLFAVVICCGIYPAVVWAIGQSLFHFQANGSIVKGPDGAEVGSLLIAQAFTKDEYFQPRPSSAGSGYDATASSSSGLAVSNYALRSRVATTLGPIVKYKGGSKDGQLVAPDIEAWFAKDSFQGNPAIVAQWADAHNSVAQGWVGTTFDPKNPTPQQQYVLDWEQSHAAVVAKFKSDNPTITDPQPGDLAVVFFETFSKEHPGKFLSAVTAPAPTTAPTTTVATTAPTTAVATTTAAATAPTTIATTAPTTAPVTVVQIVDNGSDIQSNFFDLWRQDHPDVALADVPGDMVTSSGSGLDPHITLQNAEFQLDRVAPKWAADTKRNADEVRKEIDQMLQDKATAPFGGLAGEKMINVLEVNLLLRQKYGAPS